MSGLLHYKATKQARDQYKINTHQITVLFACYVCSVFIKDIFLIYNVSQILNSYNYKRLREYINSLVSIGLITLAGANKYKLSSDGLQVIQDINNNMDKILYNFCNVYNIDL
ncbi:MAG: hypothetical protein KA807_16385 [Prolixibacteraceae bacterium]|nr:hypothetical protein [Prolixibacteraceae bacterium]